VLATLSHLHPPLVRNDTLCEYAELLNRAHNGYMYFLCTSKVLLVTFDNGVKCKMVVGC
jgi:hypothetical protein